MPRDDWTMSLLADQGAYRGDYPDWMRPSHEAEGPPTQWQMGQLASEAPPLQIAPRPGLAGNLREIGGRMGSLVSQDLPTGVEKAANYYRNSPNFWFGAANPQPARTEEELFREDQLARHRGEEGVRTGFYTVFDPFGVRRSVGAGIGALGSGAGSRIVQPQPTGQIGELANPFYSAVESAVTAAKQPQAAGPQWLGTLRNAPGVKPEEIERLGLEPWLQQQPGPVSRQQLQDYVAANRINVGEVRKELGLTGGAAKFPSYQLPGGENYRETLLTLPEQGPVVSRLKDIQRRLGEINEQPAAVHQGPEGPALLREFDALQSEKARLRHEIPPTFTASHWDEPNVLAHYRANDRVIDGKKTLFLEEVQSDWHQKGRKLGYQTDTSPSAEAKGVPDAPFKTTWPELTLKRAIREAAEGGYDQIAWTPGKVQAERYDLSKHIGKLEAWENRNLAGESEGTWSVVAHDPAGKRVINEGPIEASDLPNYVGKELADKIVGQGGGTFHGLDLQVGGEGMKGFYDKMLPAAANKIGKKHGAQVGEAQMPTGNVEKFELGEDIGGRWRLFDRQTQEAVGPTFRSGAEAEKWLMEQGHINVPVHTLPITPQLRETALRKGFPLFTLGAGATTMGALAAQDRYQQE